LLQLGRVAARRTTSDSGGTGERRIRADLQVQDPYRTRRKKADTLDSSILPPRSGASRCANAPRAFPISPARPFVAGTGTYTPRPGGPQGGPATKDKSALIAALPAVSKPITGGRRLVEAIARLIVPATTPGDESIPDDYRRAVVLIAGLAVGFFLPSLPIAGVPSDHWPPFLALTLVAGLVLAGSFVLVPRGSRLIYPWAVVNALMLALLGIVFGPWYHQLDLAYCLLVAGHAVVHGFGPAALMAGIGSLVVPLAINEGVIESSATNLTDPIYAAIYLLGVAMLPWVAERLARGRLVEVRRNLHAVIQTEREAVQMLARAAEAKDDVTGDHVVRVGELAGRLAGATGMGLAEVDDLRFAAMLHDVGKLHVPDAILMKPDRLAPDEWEAVRQHTIWGERILGSSAGFELARRIARSHHENWDGTGYPDRIGGERIPLPARIVHLVDVFDALRAERPYKAAWSLERCLDEIARQAGAMFDPDLTRVFLDIVLASQLSDLVGDPGPQEAKTSAPPIVVPAGAASPIQIVSAGSVTPA
jgi:hypothetical protein